MIERDDALKKHHTQIQISEKLNLIKQLEVRLEHIQQVEVEQVKLQMSLHKREVENLQNEIKRKDAIDVQPLN